MPHSAARGGRITEAECICFDSKYVGIYILLPRFISYSPSIAATSPNATLCNAMFMYLYCSWSAASSTVAARFVTFCPSELLPATAELDPSASFRSGSSPKLQLDSSELGAAGLGDVFVAGTETEAGSGSVGSAGGVECTGVESVCSCSVTGWDSLTTGADCASDTAGAGVAVLATD